jgi:hypothetical protein
MRRLLCLLHVRAGAHISADIGCIGGLPHDPFDRLPCLSCSRWSALVGNEGVAFRCVLMKGILNEAALVISSTEEDGVDDQENPGSFRECNGGEQNTEPKEDFEDRNKRHARVIVVLDELANHVTHGGSFVCGFAAGRNGSVSTLLWGLNGWNDVCASVGCDVENGVDAEWE